MIINMTITVNEPWVPHVNDLNDDYLYISSISANGSISIFNTTWTKNITSPSLKYMKTQGYGSYAEIHQDGNYLYGNPLYTYDSNPQNKSLCIWNITDPTNLTNVSRTILNTYSNLCLFNATGHDFAFTRHYSNPGYGDYGINIVDLLNKSLPANVGYIPDGGLNPPLLHGCHWMQLHYNNITDAYVLYTIGFFDGSWVTFNITINQTFMDYNIDSVSPWSYSFNFPNGTGYYEFYSIGRKSGSENETIPEEKDAMCMYYISNTPPTASNPYYSNNSVNNNLYSILSIDVNDIDSDSMNVTFRTNESGAWATFGANTTVLNGTYSQYGFMFTNYNTKYWWSINLTDSHYWVNYTYCFTTKNNTAPIVSNEYPTNGSTGVSVWLPGVHAYFSDINGDSMIWNITLRNESASDTNTNITGYLNTSYKFAYNTIYYWWANVTDSFNSSNNTFHFRTMNNTAPVISTPYPTNGSMVSSALTQIRIIIGDLETFNYTMELSNGVTTHGDNVSNGTKILNLGGSLNDGTIYVWWVNASDGINTSTAWYTFTTTNATGGIGGNITVSFDITQLGLLFLIIMTIFFMVMGYLLVNSTGGVFLFISACLLFNLMMFVMVYFGGVFSIGLTPLFVGLMIVTIKDGVIRLKNKNLRK
jgi:hypothetical protein